MNKCDHFGLRLLTASLLLALSACGGDTDSSANASIASDDGSGMTADAARRKWKPPPVAPTQPTPGDPAIWTKIAVEGQTFMLSGTQTVRYGSGTSWVLKTLADSGTCSNEFFGNDPLYGTAKQCEVSGTPTVGTTPTPTPLPAPPSTGLVPRTKADASRFLQQASMGPNMAEIDKVLAQGYVAWIDEQMAKPAPSTNCSPAESAAVAKTHCQMVATMELSLAGQWPSSWFTFTSFWKQAVTADDQLRQRVAFALSQIFVVSMSDEIVQAHGRGVAAYLDTLGRHSFGNYRELLEDVARSPMMGMYLSHMKNRADGGRKPDENFAREVMQLFSIGLHELNADGTPKRGANGQPIETYSREDVTEISKVFTGFSWHGPEQTGDNFFRWQHWEGERNTKPMTGYAQFHSQEAKRFLGITCPAGTSPDASLTCALDRLFNHPNVGPFIGKQLIQRLVTSNPSPAYVARVSAAFANNGTGVRGDMRAVLRAILLDPEARDVVLSDDPAYGKIKEPVLRITQWLRAFDARSQSGEFRNNVYTMDPAEQIGMTPMFSPSVFNFYRPGYVPPNTSLAERNLTAPELQITNETSGAGYMNGVLGYVMWGFGQHADTKVFYPAEMAVAHDPDALLDRVDLLLAGGRMSAMTRSTIRQALVAIPVATTATATEQQAARRERALSSVYLTLASPDAMVQK
jgi:uncharacterized protein (DUF1800 family)